MQRHEVDVEKQTVPHALERVRILLDKERGMILSEIKKYLMKHKRVTLGDLACHFDTEPEAMKGMLGQWIRKGKVLKLDEQAGCSKACGKCCNGTAMEIYEWTH